MASDSLATTAPASSTLLTGNGEVELDRITETREAASASLPFKIQFTIAAILTFLDQTWIELGSKSDRNREKKVEKVSIHYSCRPASLRVVKTHNSHECATPHAEQHAQTHTHRRGLTYLTRAGLPSKTHRLCFSSSSQRHTRSTWTICSTSAGSLLGQMLSRIILPRYPPPPPPQSLATTPTRFPT